MKKSIIAIILMITACSEPNTIKHIKAEPIKLYICDITLQDKTAIKFYITSNSEQEASKELKDTLQENLPKQKFKCKLVKN